MRKKRNDFDAVGVERMTDAELSKKLGGYQRTESISISLGVLLVIAGCISMFIQHDPILVCALAFPGVALFLLVAKPAQTKKKALMQQLLTGKKRLLDENGVRFSTEWEFKRISEIATRVQRKNDAAEHPILTISSLSGFVRQDERYSRYMAGESVKNYILLKKGEFAYNKGNSKTYEFGCIFDLEAYEAGLVPHVYVCFRLKNGLSHRYFKYLFEADYLKPQLGALVNTGVRNNGLLNIKPTEFMQTKVPVPCFEEQESIADMLYNSSRTIRVLQDKLACLKDEKKALMQQLLTGKRRVKVDEAVAV